MNRTVRLFIGENQTPVGSLHHNAQGSRENASFAYDPAWLAAQEKFALEPNLPLVAGTQFRRRSKDGSLFHAIVADTEPDGWGKRVILRDHAKQKQQARLAGHDVDGQSLNELDFLLAVDDFSRVGALRFQDENGVFQRTTEEGRRTAPPLIELADLLAASRAVEMNNETAADLAYLRGRGTSLGGLRPKCTVIDKDGNLSIGKFPSVTDDRPVTKGEVLALHLATAAGINAASARIVNSDGAAIALIRRFDRAPDGKRFLYASAATLTGIEPRDPDPHTYTDIVDAIRVHGADAQADIDELWRRIAFSILITNVDDHLLNHGFLHVDHGRWRLSPAFDINPFPERVRELKTWISENTGPDATIDALMSATPYFRITPARAKTILAEVEAAVANWRSVGKSFGLSEVELDKFADAFEHKERQAARKVMA